MNTRMSIALLASVLLSVSCNVDVTEDLSAADGHLTFSGKLTEQTKIALNEGVSQWECGDKIGVFSIDDEAHKGVNVEYEVTSCSGSTALFDRCGTDVGRGERYFAYYPYKNDFPALNGYAAKTTNDNHKECYFAVNGTQAFCVVDGIHNGVSNQKCFYAGSGYDNSTDNIALNFKPMFAVLELGLTGNTEISAIEISFRDPSAAIGRLTGKGIIDLADQSVTITNYNTPTFVRGVFRKPDNSTSTLKLSSTEQRLKFVVCDFSAMGGLTIKFTRASDGKVFSKDIWADASADKVTSYIDVSGVRKRKHIYQPLNAVTDDNFVGTHPRLLFGAGKEAALKVNIAADSRWTKLHEIILTESDVICGLEPKTYNVVGGRLHTTSCEVVRRVLYLSYAYRMTGLTKYLDRAEEEMLAVAAFPDWHPYHFLDVAEMAFGVAIGYDWLYNDLSSATRATLCNAIRDMGLLPSETGTDYELRWMEMENNWAQVCHGSLAVAALAIIDEEPAIANRIIERSKEKIAIPMRAEYAPMGAYPEGIGYWSYGTTLNAIFIAVLEDYYGSSTATAIKNVAGFMQTGNYYSQLVTNTLNTFGFSDNSTSSLKLQPVLLWFYGQTGDNTLLYHQAALIDKYTDPDVDYKNGRSYSNIIFDGSGGRHLPLMVIWGAGTGDSVAADLDSGVAPSELFYLSNGKNPICVMRNGWQSKDAYVGFKVGSPSCPHGHMDVGSFCFEYRGARFAVDLGSDSYGAIALADLGGSMFDMSQQSIRWTVLHRYNNKVHNTLTINGQNQTVDAKSEFVDYSDTANSMYAVGDLTPSYYGQVADIKRAVAFCDKKYVVVEDLITANDAAADVVWNMTTKAGVSFAFDAASNIITIQGKNSDMEVVKLKIKVVLSNPTATPEGISVTRSEVNDSLNLDYETSAAGHYFIRIAYRIAEGQTQRMKCYLLPDDTAMPTSCPDFIGSSASTIDDYIFDSYTKE